MLPEAVSLSRQVHKLLSVLAVNQSDCRYLWVVLTCFHHKHRPSFFSDSGVGVSKVCHVFNMK